MSLTSQKHFAPEDTFVSTGEACKLTGLSNKSLHDAARKELVIAFKDRRGHWMFRQDSLLRLLEDEFFTASERTQAQRRKKAQSEGFIDRLNTARVLQIPCAEVDELADSGVLKFRTIGRTERWFQTRSIARYLARRDLEDEVSGNGILL